MMIEKHAVEKPRARQLAAALMLISGVTHVAQLLVYGTAKHVMGAALFGVAYFVIGLALLGRSRIALWFGALLPCIGGTLGIIRFLTIQANPFSVFHVMIDLVVIPTCFYLLFAKRSR